MNRLRNLYNLFAHHKEGGWIMMPFNARRLYRLVLEKPVKRILDLGTGIGCSAAIIASAMEEKGEKDYEIHTIEQFKKCYDIAKEFIPEELRKNTKFYLEKVTAWNTKEFPYMNFSVYENLPEGNWDLVLNDGPGPFLFDNRYVDLDNGTILKWLIEQPDFLRTGDLIAFDGRLSALKTIETTFGDNFYIVNPTQEFNVLERKDNPAKFNDAKMKRMTDWNYFGPDGKDGTKVDEINELTKESDAFKRKTI